MGRTSVFKKVSIYKVYEIPPERRVLSYHSFLCTLTVQSKVCKKKVKIVRHAVRNNGQWRVSRSSYSYVKKSFFFINVLLCIIFTVTHIRIKVTCMVTCTTPNHYKGTARVDTENRPNLRFKRVVDLRFLKK